MVEVQAGLCVGSGGLFCAAVCITLGDGLVIGTLSSGVVGNRGQSTLSDGVPVVGGAGASGWSVGRRISRSFWMAWDCTMHSLVEDGTVLPMVVSVSTAWMIV